ncbi:DMT family transporter [Janthinobacterium sp. 64]|uniref:DMT family transporter n=1 Tax=Janthinobacterium sp. 64 TaxID=2035208 RepID=UPI000C2BC159|nr:DMT family transporter [Janthinobacterium sp. 64]PKB22308.1 drug/metabolite transporter (DMT)-like permease [Janthinobacterium sp. 64]
MSPHKNIDGKAALAMVVLCFVWSMQQIGLKATAHDASPILQVAIRSGIAAVLVGLFMLVRQEKIMPTQLPWRAGLGAGALFSIEYLSLGEGLHLTSSAHGVVFLYTGPLFAAVGLHFRLTSERMVPFQWMGVVFAFLGIAIAFLSPADWHAAKNNDALLGDGLCLLAGASWGATTVLVRSSGLAKASASQTTFYQLVVAFVLLLAASHFLGQWSLKPTPMLLANLVFQTVLVSFISLLAWFALLRRYLASRLGAFSFMTPLFGVALGAWLLDEPVSAGFLIGAFFVVAGIIFVNCHELLARRLSLVKLRKWRSC